VSGGPEQVDALLSKLLSARRHRGVVCAAPEVVNQNCSDVLTIVKKDFFRELQIKSLLLKFVEQLHALEQTDIAALSPHATAARATRNAIREVFQYFYIFFFEIVINQLFVFVLYIKA
jgi:hypothetical protein